MKFEEISDWTGTWGAYQVCIIASLYMMRFMMNDSMILIFPLAGMPHFCRVPELANLSHADQKTIAIPGDGGGRRVGEGQKEGEVEEYSQCEMYAFNYSAFQLEDFIHWNRTERMEAESPEVVKCSQWNYEQTMFSVTAVSRFDLVCANDYLVPLIKTFFMSGLLVGGLLSGTISDKFGRKRAVAVFMFIRMVGWALSTSSLSYVIMVSGRFIIGVGQSGMYLPMVVLFVELFPVEQRAIVMAGSAIANSAGFIVHTVIAYVIRDDVKYQLAVMLPNVFLFFFLLILPESLRWLILKGRHDEAKSVILRYMVVNGRTSIATTKVIDTRNIDLGSKKSKEQTNGQVEINGGLFLLRRREMRTRTLIMNFTWFTASLMYFSLLLNVGTFNGNIYINTLISGALEIPARIVAIFLVDSRFLGRRLTNAGILLLMAVSSAIGIPLILTGAGIASTAASLTGKVFATMSFNILFIYTAELYPTQIRSLALGTTSISSRIGGIVAPYMGTPTIRVWKPLPFLIYGILSTIAALLGLLLPETLGQSLLDTVEQTESELNRKLSLNGQLVPTSEKVAAALTVEDPSAVASAAAASATTGAASCQISSVMLPVLGKTCDSAYSITTSDNNSIKSADNMSSSKSSAKGDATEKSGGTPCVTEKSGRASNATEKSTGVSYATEKSTGAPDVIEKFGGASNVTEKSGAKSYVTEKSTGASYAAEKSEGGAPDVTEKFRGVSFVTEKSGKAYYVTEKSAKGSHVLINGSKNGRLPDVCGRNISTGPVQKGVTWNYDASTKTGSTPRSPGVIYVGVKTEVNMTSAAADNFADDSFICHL